MGKSKVPRFLWPMVYITEQSSKLDFCGYRALLCHMVCQQCLSNQQTQFQWYRVVYQDRMWMQL